MNLFSLLGNAGRLKEMAEEFKQSLKAETVEGSAGGGMVIVRMSGAMEVKSVVVDPQVMADGDAEMLGDLVASAFTQAVEKSKALVAKKVQDMGLPQGLLG